MKSLTEQQRKVELFLFVRTDNVWIKKKVNVTCRYRRKATTNTKKLLIQFIKNIQHSYSIRNPGGKPGREFDRIFFFLENVTNGDLVLCVPGLEKIFAKLFCKLMANMLNMTPKL